MYSVSNSMGPKNFSYCKFWFCILASYACHYPASGFYVGNGIIITAGHVSETLGIEKVVFENGDEYNVIRQITHSDYDCGFLLINDPNKLALVFDFAEVQRGEEIFILGNPKDLIFVSTKGVVSGVTDSDGCFGDTLLIVTDASSYNGNSGSPLLDINGEIRGVHVGWVVAPEIFGVNVCVKDILKALDAAGLQLPK